MPSPLMKRIRTEFEKVADSSRAPQMQAYMKSEMPYHGVSSPMCKRIQREVFKDLELPTAKVWQTHVLDLWTGAKFREERYAALGLAGHKRAKEFQTPSAMKMYEELIVSGAWWDYVDDIAAHRVGYILGLYPAEMKKMMLAWSKSQDMWKRRTSIICQLTLKQDTDLDFLYKCIEPSLSSKEFFLRKAIGWALRQVAWHDPKEIIRYVKQNRAKLSPLSKREALKNVIKSGKIKNIP